MRFESALIGRECADPALGRFPPCLSSWAPVRSPIMKKGCLIVLAVGVVLSLIGAAVVFFVFRLTAPLVTEGEKFLNTAGNSSLEAAYAMASATLR